VRYRLTFPTLEIPSDKSLQAQAPDPVWPFSAASNRADHDDDAKGNHSNLPI
jgi:hypothetical protein